MSECPNCDQQRARAEKAEAECATLRAIAKRLADDSREHARAEAWREAYAALDAAWRYDKSSVRYDKDEVAAVDARLDAARAALVALGEQVP